MEQELLIRMAPLVDDREHAASGLAKKVRESLGIGASALSSEEQRKRTSLRDRILAEVKPHTPDIADEYVELGIRRGPLAHVVAKIVRGCE